MKIRIFKDKDAVKTSRCIVKSLKQVSSQYYSSRVIAHLRKRNLPRALAERAKNCTIIVAEEKNNIIGTANLSNDGWLGAFFVDPAYIGRGVGTRLLREMERIAKRKKFKAIRTHSAVNAVGFYKKNGYRLVKPVLFKGVGKTYRMFKRL
ncbi:MAG: GNAT family N-acetyltransferase [Candidatus Micrarchaeota archaeon]|nr:GNAT family N-acetyltransferase [Candidatus Micrarchaeota archaeon]